MVYDQIQEAVVDTFQFRVNVAVCHTANVQDLNRDIVAGFVNQSGDDRVLYVIQAGIGRVSVMVKSFIGEGH
ncbi:MAG: hypothetical protein WCG25_03860 [bacterium]